MIIHDVEQNTDAWEKKRCVMPTGSNGSKIIKSDGSESTQLKPYAEYLAQNKYAGEPVDAWEGNSYTERGHEMEPIARAWYENQYFVDLEVVGFVTNDLETYGCSPDRRIHRRKLLEIKCFPKSHYEILRKFKKQGTCPTKCKAQTQFQMLTCEADETDLLFWHPKLPKLVITVERDQVFIGKLEALIEKTIVERDLAMVILNSYPK